MVKHMRFNLRTLAVAGAIVASVGAIPIASAQRPSIFSPLPANANPSITLASGVIVRQGELTVFRGHSGSTLTITIETPTRASDSTRVALEAREIAALYGEHERSFSVDRIVVAVCRTQACLELHESATERFTYARAKDGSWSPARP
jgi:hypothetical protein